MFDFFLSIPQMGKKTDGNTISQLMTPAKGLSCFLRKVHHSVTVTSYFPMYQQGSSLITDFFFHSCRGSIDINNSAIGVLKEPTEAERIPPEIQAETN